MVGAAADHPSDVRLALQRPDGAAHLRPGKEQLRHQARAEL